MTDECNVIKAVLQMQMLCSLYRLIHLKAFLSILNVLRYHAE